MGGNGCFNHCLLFPLFLPYPQKLQHESVSWAIWTLRCFHMEPSGIMSLSQCVWHIQNKRTPPWMVLLCLLSKIMTCLMIDKGVDVSVIFCNHWLPWKFCGLFPKYTHHIASLCCKYEFNQIVIFWFDLGVFLLKVLFYMFTSKFMSLVYSPIK